MERVPLVRVAGGLSVEGLLDAVKMIGGPKLKDLTLRRATQ
jgi:hypothetical protein